MQNQKLLSKSTAHGEPAFPWKLHSVLEESVSGGFDHIVSWEADNAFKVHDPIQFENTVMKRFFNHTQYKSFQRQLNIYGFTRIKTGGRATGAYKHPCFVRGNPDACRFMIRIKIKNKGLRSKMNIKTNTTRVIRSQLLDRLMQYNDEVLPCLFPTKRSAYFDDAPSTSTNNDVIEPTPIACGSFQASTTTGTMGSPVNVPYNSNSYPFNWQENQQPCDNDELDLDTIFDDDAHVFHRNRNTIINMNMDKNMNMNMNMNMNKNNCYNNYTKPIHAEGPYRIILNSIATM